MYSFVYEEGNLAIEGDPTKVESKYNLVNTYLDESKEDDYWEREDIKIPDGKLVMEIAESWSVNPSKIGELEGTEGVGLVGY